MKPLLPTLKEKKRYLVYLIDTNTKEVLPKSVHHKLVTQVRKTLGLFEAARAGVEHIRYDSQTQQGILKTSLSHAPQVRAALTLITSIENVPVRVRVVGASGVLNKTERFTLTKRELEV